MLNSGVVTEKERIKNNNGHATNNKINMSKYYNFVFLQQSESKL